ncbi:hypothetical protein [Pseudomonas sp. OTU5201]|uniref:hypothetical protein n=1 Tax=Pseudomonas sp. OTU5201 TaxID=3043850 RepID=UPI00313C9A13
MKRSTVAESVARDVSRRVKRGTRCHVYGSAKNPGLTIAAESFLERDIGYLLELDPRVHSYREQPFTLELVTGERLPSRKHFVTRTGLKPSFYTPDFLCGLAGGVELVLEVKSQVGLAQEQVRLQEAACLLQRLGMRLVILTEAQLTPALVVNAKYLKAATAPYLQDRLEPVLEALNQAAAERACWTSGELAQTTHLGLFGVAVAVVRGIFSADLTEDLFAPDTPLRAGLGDLSHLEVLPL